VMGQPAIMLMISAQYGANTLQVTSGLDAALAELRPALERQGITLHANIFRPAAFIGRALHNVRTSLMIGAILIVVVLFLFLFNLRTAAISATAIPLSLIAAVIVLALGIGANLNKWSAEDSKLAKRMIALDKRIRETVQLGSLYRLLSPRTNDVTANEYVASNGGQAVLFAFRHSQEYNTPPPTIQLQGLNARAVYKMESIDGKLIDKRPELSGAYLMENGLNLNLRGDFDSTAVLLHRIN